MSVPSVTICTSKEAGIDSLLEQTLQKSRLWNALEAKRKSGKLTKENFSILIKPDLGFYEINTSTVASTRLVEHLASLLASKGYTNIMIADGEQSSGTWLENRDY